MLQILTAFCRIRNITLRSGLANFPFLDLVFLAYNKSEEYSFVKDDVRSGLSAKHIKRVFTHVVVRPLCHQGLRVCHFHVRVSRSAPIWEGTTDLLARSYRYNYKRASSG